MSRKIETSVRDGRSGADVDSAKQPRPALTLIDAASITVGIIIGSAIFRIAPLVAAGAGGWVVSVLGGQEAISQRGWTPEQLGMLCLAATLAVWIVGAIVALIGAMCYAELGTAFPEVGGTYVYLSEALGRTTGFAFAWAEFWIVRPGNVGAVAYVMADYGRQLLPERFAQEPLTGLVLASAAIVVLAVLNALGLRVGKGSQNLLTAAKLLGLAAIVVVGLSVASPAEAPGLPVLLQGSLTLALIQIMFAYGGWADISFVAAEVHQPQRNIFRALLLGTAVVTAIYLLVNMAFFHALGVSGVLQSTAPAADVLSLRLGSYGSRAISLLVVVSCLGAINGMLFTGARVFYALGTHHPGFRWLGAWNEHTGVPLRSLVLQVLVTLGLVVACRDAAGFERLVVFTAPFYWGFIALVGVALIVLRLRGRTASSSYRVPLFPLTPLLFAASSAAMVYAGVDYALQYQNIEVRWGLAVITIGLVVACIDWRARHR
jgi:amino acid transporter